MSPNDGHGMANSADPDQTARAVWSGSTLFAQAYLSENLGSLRNLKSYCLCLHISCELLNEHMSNIMTKTTNEPEHDKTNKFIYALVSICPVWWDFCNALYGYPNLLQMESEDWSDWADAQADPSLCWARTHHLVGFVTLQLKSFLNCPLHWEKKIKINSLSVLIKLLGK